MDDPLPGKAGIVASKRLGDTVRDLNRNMLTPLIEFYRHAGKVCWRKVT